MLGINQLDFLNYTTAFKGNYRKGVHKLGSILSTTTHAMEFAKNKGGVTVVLGVPVDRPDKNSDELLAILLGSSVADTAVETFLACFYEFDDLNALLAVKTNCQAIMADPLQWRAASGSGVVTGKLVATLAGLNCASYANMAAVAASSTAMTAVAASSTAMAAVIANPTALNAVVSSSTAMAAVAASSTAMAAVAASSTAMTAVAASSTARTAITNSAAAKTALAASPLKTTVTKGGSNAWETKTIRSGKGWLISCYNANSGSEASSTWYNTDGTQTAQPAGTTTVGKYFLTSLSIYWWSSTSSITYIPIA